LKNTAQANAPISASSYKHDKIAGALLLSSGIIFTIFNTIAESIYPNYNVGTNALSDLGAVGQSTRYLWDGQLLATGILTFFGMWILVFKSSFSPRIAYPAKILFLLPAVGSILVSLFPENTILAIHTFAAFVTFLTGGLSAIYTYRFTASPFRYFVVILGAISLIAVPLLGSHPLVGFGGIERLVVYPVIIWGMALDSYLMAS
jgi:hypothetical membrane protein